MASEGQEQRLKPQNFDYFLVLDFEATCEKDGQIKPQVPVLVFAETCVCSKCCDHCSQFDYTNLGQALKIWYVYI